MPTAQVLLLFIATSLPLTLSPGPGMVYVASQAAAHGRRAGIVSAMSLEIGTLVHVSALALGLSALLTRVPVAYEAVRWVGAAYLVYLGARLLRGAPGEAGRPIPAAASLRRICLQGVLAGTLNPRVALFLVAFLPRFVEPSRGYASLQIFVLGALLAGQGILVDSCVAIAASSASSALGARHRGAGRPVAPALFRGGHDRPRITPCLRSPALM